MSRPRGLGTCRHVATWNPLKKMFSSTFKISSKGSMSCMCITLRFSSIFFYHPCLVSHSKGLDMSGYHPKILLSKCSHSHSMSHALYTHITFCVCRINQTKFTVLIGQERSSVGRKKKHFTLPLHPSCHPSWQRQFQVPFVTVLWQLQCHTIGSHHFCISSNLYNENFQKNSHKKGKPWLVCVKDKIFLCTLWM
jgi:hypothetical protein